MCKKDDIKADLSHLEQTLETNRYPHQLILGCTPIQEQNHYRSSSIHQGGKPSKVVGVTLHQKSQKKLNKFFQHWTSNLCSRHSLDQITGVIYSIPCKCRVWHTLYIGETGWDLHTHVQEHEWAVSKGYTNNDTAVHVIEKNPNIQWEERQTNQDKISSNKNNSEGISANLEDAR